MRLSLIREVITLKPRVELALASLTDTADTVSRGTPAN